MPALAGGRPRIAAFMALYGTLATVNIRGTRAGARLSFVTAIVKLAPLVLLSVARDGCLYSRFSGASQRTKRLSLSVVAAVAPPADSVTA